MYNRITLIGTLIDHPQELFDTDGNQSILLWLRVPPPVDAPPTYWGLIYDLRAPDWPTGEDTFLVICRERVLIERCLQSLHKGDLICIEGRLVLTRFGIDGDLVQPLAEILASNVILLTKNSSTP